MKINVKSKPNLHHFYSKKNLVLISLLFISTLFFSPIISMASGWTIMDIKVYNEVELREAISAAPNEKGYAIYFMVTELVFEKPLEIPKGKWIALYGVCRLVGVDGMDTIIIKNGGALTIRGDIVVTHAEGDSGRGVYVERGGTLVIRGGLIYGNSADKGGGVYNKGTLCVFDIDNEHSQITENTATVGGGIYNEGTFTIVNGGHFGGNTAAKGGDVYSVNDFDEFTRDWLRMNDPYPSDHGVDVFIEPKNNRQLYTLAIAIAVVITVVIGLLFYRSKKQKQGSLKQHTVAH